jgi:anaphase-promoting complex subunit 11
VEWVKRKFKLQLKKSIGDIMESDTCAICLSGYDTDDPGNTLNCTHTFHGHCIIQWFRQESSRGQCPLCNDNPYSTDSTEQGHFDRHLYYSFNFINERCKLLKKISRRKDAPKQLVDSVQKLKKLEEEYTELKKEEREFKKTPEYKDIMQQIKTLNQNVWRKHDRIRSQIDRIVAQYPTLHIYPPSVFSV